MSHPSKLGDGDVGVVYEAEERRLHRFEAFKFLTGVCIPAGRERTR